MSILIKGMEMPTDCIFCPMFHGAWTMCSVLNKTTCVRGRPDDCPLVSVPKHGDLIERKAAYNSILEGMVMTGYQSRALDCISEFYVPTIITADPAEEGEE